MEDITDWILEREDGIKGEYRTTETKADVELKKIGYIKNEHSVMIIYRLPNTDKRIVFHKNGAIGVNNEYKGFEYFTLKELDIIQMKVEELKKENWFE